jgi:hypothetical protein
MPESNIPSAGASFHLFYDPFVAGEAPQAETFSNRMTAVKRRPKPAYGAGTPRSKQECRALSLAQVALDIERPKRAWQSNGLRRLLD